MESFAWTMPVEPAGCPALLGQVVAQRCNQALPEFRQSRHPREGWKSQERDKTRWPDTTANSNARNSDQSPTYGTIVSGSAGFGEGTSCPSSADWSIGRKESRVGGIQGCKVGTLS